ncbi:MAG TPA: GNAT family N-acetyltransferase, partial [Polyangium sp.]|nr:GNAT family N-acetyltransferase [Polyangium sp.]
MPNLVVVAPNSELLTHVQEMWGVHRSTLGFLPDGGFEEYAKAGTILAAVDASGILLGYVLYRVSRKGIAAITQLCVALDARRCGIARQLFEGMKERVADCYEISLWCRQDFE